MEAIACSIIKKENRILMVKEAKKSCYGRWNFPAGHVEKFEKITDAAIREALEETGCKAKLTGLFPIMIRNIQEETFIFFTFTAELLEENINYNKDEILDVQWIEIEEIKNMKHEQLRDYDMTIKAIQYIENNKVYPLEVLQNM